MIKAVKLLSLAMLPLLIGANASQGYREAAYRTTMYSDASRTEVVGYIIPECGYRYVQYHLEGTYTYFQEDEFVGYCTPYGWEPL